MRLPTLLSAPLALSGWVTNEILIGAAVALVFVSIAGFCLCAVLAVLDVRKNAADQQADRESNVTRTHGSVQ